MKVEVYDELALPSDELKRIRNLIDLIPDICRIIECPLPERVVFKHGWYVGLYSHLDRSVNINMDAINTLERGKIKWPYWKRTARRLKAYKPDLAVHTLSHEIAHWKQVCDGKLTNNETFTTSYWKGKANPQYFSATKKTYPKSYHDGACERDANSWAAYVIKELHREKYLYK